MTSSLDPEQGNISVIPFFTTVGGPVLFKSSPSITGNCITTDCWVTVQDQFMQN
jgi:hypothetical protein